MSITASEARQRLFPLIEEVNDDQIAVEIVSRRGRRSWSPPTSTAR
ncbi:type II toxin-antitoxin system prevent-host-death family antitoxin [Modestobacter sp. I12A-02662]